MIITAYRIFLKFYLKLEEHKYQKQTTSVFSAKLSDLGKSQKNSYKIGFFLAFVKNLIYLSSFTLKLVHNYVFMILWSLCAWEKFCSSMMAQNALIQSDCCICWLSISMVRINWYLRFYAWKLKEGSIKGKQHLRLLLLVDCGLICLTSNQIAEFFDHQYLWKESIGILEFLHRDDHKVR